MSILIIGDLHIKISNQRQTDITQNDIMRTLHERDINFVVILGDTLDNHEKINLECLNRAANLFEAIMSTGKHLYVLIGNHDRSNNKVYMTNVHPFRGFDGRQGVTIIYKCEVHKIFCTAFNTELSFCFVPFVPDGMFLQALSDCNIQVEEVTMFFSHSEFTGCKINKISKSKCDSWPPNYPLNISGHIHEEEVVQSNLIYVGTPFQHNYNDSADKGIFIFDLAKSSLEKIKLNVPAKVIKKIHYSELENLLLDPSLDTRLVIYGPTAHVKDMLKRPDLEKKFMNVQKRYKDDTKDIPVDRQFGETIHHKKFYDLLIQEVNKDEKMAFVFSGLFSAKN